MTIEIYLNHNPGYETSCAIIKCPPDKQARQRAKIHSKAAILSGYNVVPGRYRYQVLDTRVLLGIGIASIIIIIIRCQIWNRHWRPCLSKHLCHQTTSKNLNPYFVHLLPSYKDYQEMLFVVCPYRVCLLLYQLKIRIPSLYVYTHVLKIPFASF